MVLCQHRGIVPKRPRLARITDGSISIKRWASGSRSQSSQGLRHGLFSVVPTGQEARADQEPEEDLAGKQKIGETSTGQRALSTGQRALIDKRGPIFSMVSTEHEAHERARERATASTVALA